MKLFVFRLLIHGPVSQPLVYLSQRAHSWGSGRQISLKQASNRIQGCEDKPKNGDGYERGLREGIKQSIVYFFKVVNDLEHIET